MNSFQLELVTENQNKTEKAEKLGKQIAASLNLKCKEVKRYSKFNNSYRISLMGEFPHEENALEYSIKITSAIASPWSVYYDRHNNKLELIFNVSPRTKFEKEAYNVLIWGQFLIE